MEDGMKSGKTQRANLTPATLLHYWPSSALVLVRYKTEQKQDRFENQTPYQCVTLSKYFFPCPVFSPQRVN